MFAADQAGGTLRVLGSTSCGELQDRWMRDEDDHFRQGESETTAGWFVSHRRRCSGVVCLEGPFYAIPWYRRDQSHPKFTSLFLPNLQSLSKEAHDRPENAL